MKSSIVLLLTIISLNHIYSQNQFGLGTSFQYGELLNTSSYDYFESNHTFGFGLIYRKQLPSNVYINSVLAYHKVGWYALDYKIKGEEQKFDLYWKGKALNVSSDIGYYLFENEMFQLGISLGLNLGLILDQEYQIIEDGSNELKEFYTERQFLPSLEFNLDLAYKISNQFTLNLRPNWNHYIYFHKNKYKDRNLGIAILALYTLSYHPIKPSDS